MRGKEELGQVEGEERTGVSIHVRNCVSRA